MTRKTISYRDDAGQIVTEDFLFHLSKPELIAMNNEHNGNMAGYLRKIIDTRRATALMAEMQAIVIRAYGKMSEDGTTFVKVPELTDEFATSQACVQLMDELCCNAHFAARFISEVVGI